MKRISKKNGCELFYVEQGEFYVVHNNTGTGIEVYPPMTADDEFTINWAAIGSVDCYRTHNYIQDLKKAMAAARHFRYVVEKRQEVK